MWCYRRLIANDLTSENRSALISSEALVASTVVTWKNLDEKLEFLFGFL
jgi:hypothetical protein